MYFSLQIVCLNAWLISTATALAIVTNDSSLILPSSPSTSHLDISSSSHQTTSSLVRRLWPEAHDIAIEGTDYRAHLQEGYTRVTREQVLFISTQAFYEAGSQINPPNAYSTFATWQTSSVVPEALRSRVDANGLRLRTRGRQTIVHFELLELVVALRDFVKWHVDQSAYRGPDGTYSAILGTLVSQYNGEAVADFSLGEAPPP